MKTGHFASTLLRYRAGLGLARPQALRLACTAKTAYPEGRRRPSQLDVLVNPAQLGPAGARVVAAMSPRRDRTALLIPEACLSRLQTAAQQRAVFRKAFLLATARRDQVRGPGGDRKRSGKPKALFFRRLLNSPDKELGSEHMYQGVFAIASAVKVRGIPLVLADSRLSLDEDDFMTDRDSLDGILAQNPDINFIGLTLFDACFDKVARTIDYIRRRSDAFIAVGGGMPSQSASQVLAHLSGVNFVIRGAGEEVVPEILSVIGDANGETGLDDVQLDKLRTMRGLLFAQRGALLMAGENEVLRVEDPDRTSQDFSLLERRHVASGTMLALSRGCGHACRFCTSLDRGRFFGKSPENVAKVCRAYGRRLLEIFGGWRQVPRHALGIGLQDDNFLSDRDRAIRIFRVFRESPFYLRFFQSSVNSFFVRDAAGRWTDEIDGELLDAMPTELFLPKGGGPPGPGDQRPYVYIGTENCCDRELARLGKPYRFGRVSILVRELSRRRIRQAHHFIASNVWTEPGQVIENLAKMARFRAEFGEYYDVVRPVISHLTSFYGSPSYRLLKKQGLLSRLELRRRLAIPGWPDLDYPLVERDLPLSQDTRDLVDLIVRHGQSEWGEVLALALGHLLKKSRCLLRSPRQRRRALRLRELAVACAEENSLMIGGALREASPLDG